MVVLIRRSGVPATHLDEVFEWIHALLQQNAVGDAASAQAIALDAIDQADRN